MGKKMWHIYEIQHFKISHTNIQNYKYSIRSDYYLHNQILESVNSEKYLGAVLSGDLMWRQRISSKSKKSESKLGFIILRKLKGCAMNMKLNYDNKMPMRSILECF